jgi:hypothetical protein
VLGPHSLHTLRCATLRASSAPSARTPSVPHASGCSGRGNAPTSILVLPQYEISHCPRHRRIPWKGGKSKKSLEGPKRFFKAKSQIPPTPPLKGSCEGSKEEFETRGQKVEKSLLKRPENTKSHFRPLVTLRGHNYPVTQRSPKTIGLICGQKPCQQKRFNVNRSTRSIVIVRRDRQTDGRTDRQGYP